MPREAPEQLCLLLLTLLDQACLSACGSAIMLCWTSLRVTYLFLNDRPIINLDFSSWNQVSTTSFAETQMSHVEKLQRGSFPLSPLAEPLWTKADHLICMTKSHEVSADWQGIPEGKS